MLAVVLFVVQVLEEEEGEAAAVIVVEGDAAETASLSFIELLLVVSVSLVLLASVYESYY